MKVIIDTNVLINVLRSSSTRSASYKVLELCLKQELNPQMGAALFAEHEDVAYRDHIIRKSIYDTYEIDQILDGYFSVCDWVKINYLWRPNLKDEGDNHIVDLAVASNAKYVITQNVKDLLSGDLKSSFEVLTPEDFLKKVI
ncbi:putative toxin-antitoxin system toxin component, PIN family [Thalassotalea sp. LPB0316]|uniref:putative toxin-antitoxin system toxin component, PIN family n=1 Tax=Thalassotalea sp. LPB0316 TaxID=2769490 RepID=UPI001867C1AA|nr:putative toxin-antitoxin system toxin component, PIN family [Thalassotalea sp. LPB0316]QOL26943.1 putative toxin-antitoxin system toxin component, PIN family [Thalassotalea sp. LPB0316]